MNGHPSIVLAAARFYCAGIPLPRNLSYRDFAIMTAEEFASWCRGDDRGRDEARRRGSLPH